MKKIKVDDLELITLWIITLSYVKISSMKLKGIIQAALFAALIAISAQFRFPFILGIPITFQTLFVLLAGLYLPSPYGSKAVFLYLLTGMVGFPVFSGGGGGLAWFSGPTGGFLWGFFFAAFILQKKRQFWLSSPLKTAAGIFAGTTVIYLCGIVWFAFVSDKSPVAVLPLFLSFLPGELVKMVLAWLFIRREINSGSLNKHTIIQNPEITELTTEAVKCP
jgi:biotin transport system substrate-specific component